MGTREVYEEKLRRGNLDYDPTTEPGVGSARCPRCLSPLNPIQGKSNWELDPALLFFSRLTTKLSEAFDDLRTWLSSAGTYQQTCIDELGSVPIGLGSFVDENFKNSTEYTSNSLAIMSSFEESINALGAIKRRRRLMSRVEEPAWVSFECR